MIFNWFKKKEQPPQKTENIKDLLRENLNTVKVDVFYGDDPLIGLPPGERVSYLKHFHELSKDERLMERIKYLINKQALLTIQNVREKDGSWETAAGAMNVNGIALVKDDINRLSTIHIKELVTPDDDYDKYKV